MIDRLENGWPIYRPWWSLTQCTLLGKWFPCRYPVRPISSNLLFLWFSFVFVLATWGSCFTHSYEDYYCMHFLCKGLNEHLFELHVRVDTSGNLQGKGFNCPSCRCLYRINFVVIVLSLIYPNFILQSYAQDGKNWNDNASCYVYRHNQRHLLTIRNVERGEKLILPKGAAHWQWNEEGLLCDYAYETENIKGRRLHEPSWAI